MGACAGGRRLLAVPQPTRLSACLLYTSCHTDKDTKKGPAWTSVAAKYKGKPDPTATLVDMLKTGGKDDHEVVKGASDADLKAVIAIVLASK